MVVRHGEEARQAIEEQRQRSLTPLGIMVRLLPVWVLLIAILILEPSLPVRAIGAAIQWTGDLIARPTPQPAAEPVFIIEGAQSSSVESDLPPPNWSLELSPVFTPEVQYWSGSIANWSVIYRVKPNLIATLVQIESCGNPTAVSEAGAQGLFQVLPTHFSEGENPQDPDINAQRGLEYLAEMYALAHGDIGLTFAAYNGGPLVIGMSPSEWPEETQYYQFWGSGIYEEAEQGLQESPTLIEWLEAGGLDLCIQAAEVLGISHDAEGGR